MKVGLGVPVGRCWGVVDQKQQEGWSWRVVFLRRAVVRGVHVILLLFSLLFFCMNELFHSKSFLKGIGLGGHVLHALDHGSGRSLSLTGHTGVGHSATVWKGTVGSAWLRWACLVGLQCGTPAGRWHPDP